MIVTFCGHRDYPYDNIKDRLENEIRDLIKQGATEFLLGGYGAFDLVSAGIIKKLQNYYPHIKSVLVLAYLNRDYDTYLYHESVYPPIENVPKRLAILRRNEWMVEQSDVIISGVYHFWGGAAQTLHYAQRKNKKIIQL